MSSAARWCCAKRRSMLWHPTLARTLCSSASLSSHSEILRACGGQPSKTAGDFNGPKLGSRPRGHLVQSHPLRSEDAPASRPAAMQQRFCNGVSALTLGQASRRRDRIRVQVSNEVQNIGMSCTGMLEISAFPDQEPGTSYRQPQVSRTGTARSTKHN